MIESPSPETRPERASTPSRPRHERERRASSRPARAPVRRVLAVLAWTVALLAAAFLVVTQTVWGRTELRAVVVSTLRSELGMEPRIGDLRLELRIWPPAAEVVANDVSLDDPVHGTFLDVRRLAIRPSLGALVAGRVDLRAIELDRPRIHLVVREGEVQNLPRFRARGGGDGRLPFRSLRVREGSLTVSTDRDLDLVLDRFALDVRVRGGEDLALQLDASGGFLHVHGVEQPVERFVVTASLDAGELIALDQVVVRTPSLRLELGDVRVPLPFRDEASGTVRGRLDLAALARLPENLGLPALEGELEVDLDGFVRGQELGGEGRVRVRDGIIEERYGLGDLVDLHVTATPEAIEIHPDSFLEVIDGGGRVGLGGRISLALPMPASITLDVRELELGHLMGQLGVTPNAIVTWYLSAGIELRGTLAPFVLRGPIRARTHDFLVTAGPWHARPRERVVGVERGSLDGQVHLTDSALRFDDLALDTGRTRADVDVEIGFGQTFRVEAHVSRIDLADVSPLVDYPLAGVGTIDLLVEGLYDDPSLGGHASIRGFSFDGMGFGDVETDYRMEAQGYALRFPDVEATRAGSRYRVRDLLLDFSDDRFEATAAVHLDRLALDDAYAIFGLDEDERFTSYRGVAAGDVAVRYTSDFPGDAPSGTLVLGLGLDLPSLDVDGIAFTDGRLEGTWRWLDYDRGIKGAVLELDHLALRKGDATLAVSGRMDLGGALSMTVAADRVAVEATEGLREGMPALTGHYALLGTVSGTYEVPRVRADLDVAGLTWDGEPLGGARMYVRLTDRDDPWVQRVADEGPDATCGHARRGLLHGRWPPDPPIRTSGGLAPARAKPMAFLVCGEALGGQVALDLALGWTSAYPARGVIRLDSLSLAPFAPRTAGAGIDGRVSGTVALTGGALGAPDTLSGDVRLTELSVAAGGIALANARDVRLAMRRGTLEVLEAVMMGDGTLLELAGRGSAGEGLDFALEGFVDLALLSTLTPLVEESGGRLGLEVRLRGPIADPGVYGRAAVRGAHLTLRDLPMPVRELEGDVAFSARRVLFEGFRARIGTGEAALEGAATIADGELRAYHADLRLEDLLHRPEQGLEIDLDAQTRLEWVRGMRLPLLRGRVVLDRVRYTRPVNLSPTLGELYRPVREEIERYDPAAETVELDLEIVQRSPARVSNNLVDMDVVIEDRERPLRIVGTDQRVGAIGSLHIARGNLRFRNTQLEIRSGAIELDDFERINPRFDVTAVTEIQRREDVGAPNYRLSLRAHGDLEGFRLDASSTPELAQQDVMLLLTIGMTTAEAQQLEAQDLGSVGLEALSAVSGVEGEVRGALGVIDEIELTTMYHPITNRPEPQVTIGTRIAGRVRLSASTGLTSETRAIQARAEWRVSQQTRIQAVYDNINRESSSSFGNLGVDLRWRLEFE